jgi:hypothetical protein
MKRGEVAHHLLVLLLLVSMDSLSVLAQVVKTRELFPAMTGEWTFPSMFPLQKDKRKARYEFKQLSIPDVPGKMFASTEHHATLAITSTLEGFCRGRAVTFVNPGQKGSWVVVGH